MRKDRKASFYKDGAFPFSFFQVDQTLCSPPGPGYRDLHWHEDLQYTLVTRGTLSMQVNETSYDLAEGEAIFINRSCLHMTHNISPGGTYVSFNFLPRLLSLGTSGDFELRYVVPYIDTGSFPAQIFRGGEAWERTLIAQLRELAALCTQHPAYAVEYEITLRLGQIWLTMIRQLHGRMQNVSRTYVRQQELLQSMLAFIHESYAQDISLADIAAAAHLSPAECGRRFKSTLHMTPYEYLLLFRIRQGAERLRQSDLSVGAVAGLVGFNDASHFIQTFKRIMHTTPARYRHMVQTDG